MRNWTRKGLACLLPCACAEPACPCRRWRREQIPTRRSSLLNNGNPRAGSAAMTAPPGMTTSITETGLRRMGIPLPAQSNGGFWTTRPTPREPAFSCSPRCCSERASMGPCILITAKTRAAHGRAATRQTWCETFYSTNLMGGEQGAVLATKKSDGPSTSSIGSQGVCRFYRYLKRGQGIFPLGRGGAK